MYSYLFASSASNKSRRSSEPDTSLERRVSPVAVYCNVSKPNSPNTSRRSVWETSVMVDVWLPAIALEPPLLTLQHCTAHLSYPRLVFD